MGWRGDPVWLPDVLRAEGLRCDIFPGAFERGHGDMGDIWGVVAHHTGSFGETPNGIANHPSLGLASQLYLSRDGVYTLCGVGIAWHAGNGSWPGLGTNNANPRTIGIEAANDGGGRPGKPHRASWSDAQYDAYVRGCAAIMRKLGYDSSHVIGHKDWAGPAQGKWDPGAIDMNIFRADIQRAIFRQPPGKQTDPVLEMLAMPDNAQMLREIHDKLLAYPAVPEIGGKWPSRARCRRNNNGVDDTVGMELYIDANVYDLLVAWSAVEVGDPASVATIRDGAAGKLPANDKDSIAWFKAVESKIAKTTSV